MQRLPSHEDVESAEADHRMPVAGHPTPVCQVEAPTQRRNQESRSAESALNAAATWATPAPAASSVREAASAPFVDLIRHCRLRLRQRWHPPEQRCRRFANTALPRDPETLRRPCTDEALPCPDGVGQASDSPSARYTGAPARTVAPTNQESPSAWRGRRG